MKYKCLDCGKEFKGWQVNEWLDVELISEHPSRETSEHIKKMMKYLEEHGAY